VTPKGAAYSWLKAPRYEGEPYECGPLARMAVTGLYPASASVMDRIRARAKEAQVLANAMSTWIAAVVPETSAYTPCSLPATAEVAGLTEAPRGALGHWLKIQNGKIGHYQVITPTCWTISPRDSAGRRGPLEQALIGTPVANVDNPVEVLRVVHSVDPCLDCATHVMRADAGAKVFALGGLTTNS
jgi:hydrogenase large subunit